MMTMNGRFAGIASGAAERLSRRTPGGPSAVLGGCLLLLFSGGTLARADSLDLNFNSPSLTNGENYVGIQSFINSQLGALGHVTVSPGAITSNSYNADGNVVGNTLAATDHMFIMNNTDGQSGVGAPYSNEIEMVFSGLAAGTYTFSFDLEIFPDINCQSSSCGSGNWPDLDLAVNGATIQQWLGVMPAPSTHNTDPQLLGNSSTPGVDGVVVPTFTISSATPTATLEFIDWPDTIAIANLDINRTSSVPETSSVLLLGTVALFLIPLFKRFRKA